MVYLTERVLGMHSSYTGSRYGDGHGDGHGDRDGHGYGHGYGNPIRLNPYTLSTLSARGGAMIPGLVYSLSLIIAGSSIHTAPSLQEKRSTQARARIFALRYPDRAGRPKCRLADAHPYKPRPTLGRLAYKLGKARLENQ